MEKSAHVDCSYLVGELAGTVCGSLLLDDVSFPVSVWFPLSVALVTVSVMLPAGPVSVALVALVPVIMDGPGTSSLPFGGIHVPSG